MTPKISIIIPVYKVEPYIEKCIQSLLDQTYTNFEALIVDDGSPDQSIGLAQKVAGDDQRFIFLKKKNGGLPSARNFGLDNAIGSYIAFLDSDDYFDTNFLKYMLNAILDSKADIAICDINMVNLAGKTLGSIKQNLDQYYAKNDIFLCDDTLSAFAWNKLYKSEVFKTDRYDENVRTYEDSHFTYRTLYNRKLIHVEKKLINYVQRPESITKSLPINLVDDKLSITKSFNDFYNSNKSELTLGTSYLIFCYLKTLVYGPSILIAKYSKTYNTEIAELISKTDRRYFTLKNIFNVRKYSNKVFIALLILKISPKLFSVLIEYKDHVRKVFH